MEFARAMAAKYPDIKTTRGRLFAEVRFGESFKSRKEAAFILCLLGYRRGFKTFTSMISEYEKHYLEEEGTWCYTDEKLFVCDLPLILGMMNTVEAHEELVRIVNNSRFPWLRAAALDGMAYEEDFLDIFFAMKVLKDEPEALVRLSAMWVMLFNTYPNPGHERRRLMRKYIVPRLHDENNLVRQYALDILAFEPSFANDIRSVLDHPDA